MSALISAIIPTYARDDLLLICIDSLLKQTVPDVEVIVVDNASPKNSSRIVKSHFGDRVKSIRLDRNLFYCGAANRGISESTGKYVAIINDDCRVEPDWAENAVHTFCHNTDVGSVASLVMREGESDIVDSAGDHLAVTGRAANLHWNSPKAAAPTQLTSVFSAAGSCAIYRRSALIETGGFDEDFVAYLDDVDLGFRLQLLGHKAMFNPLCVAHHVGGGTAKNRGYAIFLTERNMVWNLMKNMPCELLIRHMDDILLSQLRPAPIHGGISVRGWSYGKAAALRGMPKLASRRQEIQATRRVSLDYIESLLLSQTITSCHL